jgi:hypothetical protein
LQNFSGGPSYLNFKMYIHIHELGIYYVTGPSVSTRLCLLELICRSPRGSVYLSLSAEFVSYSAVFFSHNKSANSTFSHNLLASIDPFVDMVLHDGTDQGT